MPNKMPVNPSFYPSNWNSLALKVKEAARWQCQCCGKKCYKPGERPEDLTRSQWTADILQVHHRNHDTTQNQFSNLQAVCAACHLNLHRGRYSPVSLFSPTASITYVLQYFYCRLYIHNSIH